MKYPHIVIVDGVWYPAGSDVPDNVSALSSDKKEGATYSTITDEEVASSIDEEDVEQTLTKAKLAKMKAADLRVLAEKYGINNAEDLSGTEIKRNLISMLKL